MLYTLLKECTVLYTHTVSLIIYSWNRIFWNNEDDVEKGCFSGFLFAFPFFIFVKFQQQTCGDEVIKSGF